MLRKLMLITIVCAFVAAPAMADPTVTPTGSGGDIGGYGPYQAGTGGEFTLLPNADLSWVLQYYAASAKNQQVQGTFQTFCIEEYEYIYPNTAHSAVLNDRAVAGGVGPAGDPISKGTAWLYHEFQKGTLSDYDYANATSRKASAVALQNALWALEGEPGTINDSYKTMLENEFGTIANAMLDNNGQYDVRVLNLYELGHAGDNNYLRQDVLVCVPVPGAILLGLLGLSAAGIKLRKHA